MRTRDLHFAVEELFTKCFRLSPKTILFGLALAPCLGVSCAAVPGGAPGFHPPTPGWLPTTTHIEQVTLEQARQIAGFHLLEPTYLPSNIHLVTVTRIDDAIDLEYQSATQSMQGNVPRVLTLKENRLNYPAGFSTPRTTPDMDSETTLVRGISALVNRNALPPANVTPLPSTPSFTRVEWIENEIGITLIGSFNLEELKKVAESLK